VSRTHFASIAALISTAILAAGCSPEATKDLTYQQVDEKFLANTVVAIGTSRSVFADKPAGATLFVDEAMKIQRIDNDGMPNVELAYENGRIGFSDINHDYILGKNPVISKREKVEAGLHRTLFVKGELMTFINGGYGENFYELPITRTGTKPAVTIRSGSINAITYCGDEVWGYFEPNGGSPTTGPSVDIRRLEPWSDDMWTMRTSENTMSADTAACNASQLIGIGSVETNDIYKDAVLTTDITTGKGTIKKLTGHLRHERIAKEDVTYWSTELIGTDLYAAVGYQRSKGNLYELVRIDSQTGKTEKVTTIKNTGAYDTLFRIEDEILYALDVTWEEPSTIRAIRLTDGTELGSIAFDPILPTINKATTVFEDEFFVSSFVPLQPELLNVPKAQKR
jgi:hypothetical protein